MPGICCVGACDMPCRPEHSHSREQSQAVRNISLQRLRCGKGRRLVPLIWCISLLQNIKVSSIVFVFLNETLLRHSTIKRTFDLFLHIYDIVTRFLPLLYLRDLLCLQIWIHHTLLNQGGYIILNHYIRNVSIFLMFYAINILIEKWLEYDSIYFWIWYWVIF